MSNEQPTLWIGSGLRNRPTSMFATYGMFDYNKQPPVTIRDKFKDLKTIDDLEANQDWLDSILKSPTACYIEIDRENHIFFRDQQDCVLWTVHPKTGAVHILNQDKTMVAHSVPEFLTRVFIENEIWYHDYGMSDDALADDAKAYNEKLKELN